MKDLGLKELKEKLDRIGIEDGEHIKIEVVTDQGPNKTLLGLVSRISVRESNGEKRVVLTVSESLDI